MLPTRDPPQNKRPTQTEGEGLETNIPGKWKGKKSQGSTRPQNEGHKNKGSLHNTQGKNPSRRHKHYKHICIQHRSTQIYNENPGELQERYRQQHNYIGDFNTLLSIMDRSFKQNINKDIVALNNALDEMDLTDIYIQPFIPNKQNAHSFPMHMEYFQR